LGEELTHTVGFRHDYFTTTTIPEVEGIMPVFDSQKIIFQPAREVHSVFDNFISLKIYMRFVINLIMILQIQNLQYG